MMLTAPRTAPRVANSARVAEAEPRNQVLAEPIRARHGGAENDAERDHRHKQLGCERQRAVDDLDPHQLVDDLARE